MMKDLGVTYDTSVALPEPPAKEKHYPTIYLDDDQSQKANVSGLVAGQEYEGKIKVRVRRVNAHDEAGDDHGLSVDLEVLGLEFEAAEEEDQSAREEAMLGYKRPQKKAGPPVKGLRD